MLKFPSAVSRMAGFDCGCLCSLQPHLPDALAVCHALSRAFRCFFVPWPHSPPRPLYAPPSSRFPWCGRSLRRVYGLVAIYIGCQPATHTALVNPMRSTPPQALHLLLHASHGTPRTAHLAQHASHSTPRTARTQRLQASHSHAARLAQHASYAASPAQLRYASRSSASDSVEASRRVTSCHLSYHLVTFPCATTLPSYLFITFLFLFFCTSYTSAQGF